VVAEGANASVNVQVQVQVQVRVQLQVRVKVKVKVEIRNPIWYLGLGSRCGPKTSLRELWGGWARPFIYFMG
jgi:hypothetical protein